MNRKFAAVLACGVLFFSFGGNIFSAGGSVSAGRRTAVRCLKIAETYLASGDLENALSQAELGLLYDESVSDLWYIKAAAVNGLGGTRADVMPLVMKALSDGQWVDYNRDGARILYADLLCDTGSPAQAVDTLDSEPFIYSSDAEFIRIKAYYRMGTPESVNKARSKVNAARRIYPEDMRFPHLFFKYEYAFRSGKSETAGSPADEDNALVQKIADSFIAKMPEYDNPDAELEIYSAIFADGERRRRLLRAFAAHGMEHPLYAEAALSEGLLNQQEAWDYFCRFADESVSLEMLESLLPLITDSITIESVKEHLEAYSGTISEDTNGDCEPELFVEYSRGRPQSLKWDRNNDGVYEWTADCDFGVPVSVYVPRNDLKAIYGTYPYVVMLVRNAEKNEAAAETFSMADETLLWTPFDITPDYIVKEKTGIDFFIPSVNGNVSDIDENELFRVCSSYRIPVGERENAVAVFSVLDGLPQTADYSVNGTVYAHAAFENGYLSVRSVDNDGDGIFETAETFGYDPENSMHRTEGEISKLQEDLFGNSPYGSGMYIKMIQIDSTGDTVPDFSEEYLADGGKITSWDSDGDGNWNTRYRRYPRENESSPLVEDAQFYKIPDNILVTVVLWDGEPVKVETDNITLFVTQGSSPSFYWVGGEGSPENESLILENINLSSPQGVSVLLEDKDMMLSAVRIGDNIFSFVLPKQTETEIPEQEIPEEF